MLEKYNEMIMFSTYCSFLIIVIFLHNNKPYNN